MDKPRALTQKQIAAQRALQKKNAKQEYVMLYNRSTKHPLPLQLKAPRGVDFYVGDQTIRLSPGERCQFPVSRLYQGQVSNLIKAGRLAVLSGKEHLKLQ